MAEYVKKSYIILCEGASERAYIQELNRYLDDNGYNFTFFPKVIGCGHFTEVQRKYRYERKANPRAQIEIWVDADTYIRNDCDDGDKYASKPQYMPDFLFSRMNFEDFLALHLDDQKLKNWISVCIGARHNITPMCEDQYLPLVKQNLFPAYEKGEMPIILDEDRLNTLFSNNTKSFPGCDFATFLKKLM